MRVRIHRGGQEVGGSCVEVEYSRDLRGHGRKSSLFERMLASPTAGIDTLLVDLYTATVARATGRSTILQPGFPGLGVYVPQRHRTLVKNTGEFHRTQGIRGARVFPDQLVGSPGRYVVLTGPS
jgi:hypothetical protein